MKKITTRLILFVIVVLFGAGIASAQTLKWQVWGNERRAIELCGPLPNIDLSTLTSRDFYHPQGQSSVKTSVTDIVTSRSLACQRIDSQGHYRWTPEPENTRYGVINGNPVSFEGVEKDDSYKVCHNDVAAVFIQVKIPAPVIESKPMCSNIPTLSIADAERAGLDTTGGVCKAKEQPKSEPMCSNIPTLSIAAAHAAGLETAGGVCKAKEPDEPDCPTCPKSSYKRTKREGVWNTKQAIGSAVGGIPSGIFSSGNAKRKILTGAAVGGAGVLVNVGTKAIFKETRSDKAYEFRFQFPDRQEPEVFELKVGESKDFNGGTVTWVDDHWEVDVPGCGTSFLKPHTGFALTPIVYIKRTGQVAQVITPAKTTPTTGSDTPVRPGNPNGPSAGDLPNGGQLPGGPAPGPVGGVPTRPRRPTTTGNGLDSGTVVNQVLNGNVRGTGPVSPGQGRMNTNIGSVTRRANGPVSPGQRR